MDLIETPNVYFIAEIGINHNGDFHTALELINQAKFAGVNAVKFQYRNLSRAYFNDPLEIGDQILATEIKSSFISAKEILNLLKHAKKLGLDVGISLFDVLDVNDFGKSIKLFDFYKIPSVKLTDLSLIKSFLELKKPVLISTGANSEKEIVKTFSKLSRKNWVPLHCVSNYPTISENSSLGYIKYLRRKWKKNVGFSSHDVNIELMVAAYIMGASIFERHITLDRSQKGLDHSSSSTPGEIKNMVEILSKLQFAILGDKPRVMNQGEIINRQNLGKSLYFNRDILKGTKLSHKHLILRHPRVGISNENIAKYLGKRLQRDCFKGNPLTESDFEKVIQLKPGLISKMNSHKISLPVRLHDLERIHKMFLLQNYELHLSYAELRNLNRFDFKRFDSIFSLHLPDYQDSNTLFNPFLSKRSESHKLINEVLKFSVDRYNDTKKKLVVVASVSTLVSSKTEFYSYCRQLQNRFLESKAILTFQWLPPYAWYFGGSQKIEVFNNITDVDIIRQNKLNICFDTSHAFLSSNYFKFNVINLHSKLKQNIMHYHIGNAVGYDGEGVSFDKGDPANIPFLIDVIQKKQVKVIEVWQGHLDNFKGFSNAIRFINNTVS